MQRSMIIGQPGSGKSTLARKLGAITHLPVFHIDHIHWKPGWVERDRTEKTALCREIEKLPQWVFEGGHSATWLERLARADTLIWLDFGLLRRVGRVVRRTLVQYGETRPDLPEGCPEKFDGEFYRYIWRMRRSSRERMSRLFSSAAPEKTALKLSSIREIRTYLDDVSRAAPHRKNSHYS